jgi:hypothetical protein
MIKNILTIIFLTLSLNLKAHASFVILPKITDTFVSGDLTSRGKALIKFRVYTNYYTDGREYLTNDTPIKIDKRNAIPLEGSDDEYLGIVDFSKKRFGKYLIIYRNNFINGFLYIEPTEPISRKGPKILSIRRKNQNLYIKGINLDLPNGVLFSVTKKGESANLTYSYLKNTKLIKVPEEALPPDTLFIIYSAEGFGISTKKLVLN